MINKIFSLLHVLVPIVSSYETSTFLSWAQTHGAILDNVGAHVDTTSGLRGLKTISKRPSNEALIEFPRKMLIVPSKNKVMQAKLVEPVTYDKASRELKLALTLVAIRNNIENLPKQENLKDQRNVIFSFDFIKQRIPSFIFSSEHSSYWYPYIKILPTRKELATIGIWWDNAQLERLCSLSFAKQAQRLRVEREALANECLRFKNKHDSSTNTEKINKDDLFWALDIVSSRALEGRFGVGGMVKMLVLGYFLMMGTALANAAAFISHATVFNFSMGEIFSPYSLIFLLPIIYTGALMAVGTQEEIALVPVVDLINHSSASAPSYLSYDIFSDQLRFRLDRETSSEEEVFFCYGGTNKGIDNDTLLMLYGFIEEDNLHDRHTLYVSGDGILEDAKVVLGRGGKIMSTSMNSDHKFIEKNSNQVMSESDYDKPMVFTERGAPVSNTKMNAIFQTVKNDLEKLVLKNEEQHKNAPDSHDEIDITRYQLATTWRHEKIRLLNEFMECHASLDPSRTFEKL